MRDLRPRFLVHQAKANTYIKAVDGGIRDTQTSVWAEGSSFRPGAEGTGMLYFFFCHLDSYHMHVLTNNF